MPKKYRIAIFASGSGTNAEEIVKHFAHHPSIETVLLLSNNPEAYALERAKKFNIPTVVFNRNQWKETDTILHILQQHGITHVVLAGFLWLVPTSLVLAYKDRIINIHPALLPKYGGKGMYGMNVHQAVKSAGEKESGITIHAVNEHYDEGTILFQARCPVNPSDTAEDIAKKIHHLEYAHYPKTIEQWILGASPQ